MHLKLLSIQFQTLGPIYSMLFVYFAIWMHMDGYYMYLPLSCRKHVYKCCTMKEVTEVKGRFELTKLYINVPTSYLHVWMSSSVKRPNFLNMLPVWLLYGDYTWPLLFSFAVLWADQYKYFMCLPIIKLHTEDGDRQVKNIPF